VKKYDAKGKLLWERKIADKLLDKYPHDDKAYVNPLGGLNIRTRVHDLEIDESCRLFIVHSGGGCVMDENGNIRFLLLNQNPDYPDLDHSLHCVSISGGYLLNQTMFSTEDFRLYQMEEKQTSEGGMPCSRL